MRAPALPGKASRLKRGTPNSTRPELGLGDPRGVSCGCRTGCRCAEAASRVQLGDPRGEPAADQTNLRASGASVNPAVAGAAWVHGLHGYGPNGPNGRWTGRTNPAGDTGVLGVGGAAWGWASVRLVCVRLVGLVHLVYVRCDVSTCPAADARPPKARDSITRTNRSRRSGVPGGGGADFRRYRCHRQRRGCALFPTFVSCCSGFIPPTRHGEEC